MLLWAGRWCHGKNGRALPRVSIATRTGEPSRWRGWDLQPCPRLGTVNVEQRCWKGGRCFHHVLAGAQVCTATWHAMPLIRTTVRSTVPGVMNETRIPHLGDVTNTPRWCSGKESTCRCLPWSGKIPWRRTWQPIPIFLPGKSHGQKKTGGYSPWDCKELDMTERLIRLLWPTSNIPKVSKAHERCISTHTSSSPTSLLTFFDFWNQPTLLSLSVTPPDTKPSQKKKKKITYQPRPLFFSLPLVLKF